MQSIPWWGFVLTAVGTGAIASFVFTFVKEAWQRKRRVQGYRSSLDAEIDECHRIALRYTPSRIAAPLYRLPTFFYHQALPGLLADGELIGIQPKALLHFYAEVETANRGLERVDKLHLQTQLQATSDERADDAIQGEYRRITLKMRRIVRYYRYAKRVTTPLQPSLAQRTEARFANVLEKVLPSKRSYLQTCERAGHWLARFWHSLRASYQRLLDHLR